MMQMYAAAMAALLVTPACAVPVALQLTFEQSLGLSSPLSQDSYAAVESSLSAFVTRANGMQAEATILTQSANRRLQDATQLTISYVVVCGDSCDATTTVRSHGSYANIRV